LDVPILLGAGAGFGLLAQAPNPRAAIARAATAAIVANFMIIFPPPFQASCRAQLLTISQADNYIQIFPYRAESVLSSKQPAD
jgi:hypothetical protein